MHCTCPWIVRKADDLLNLNQDEMPTGMAGEGFVVDQTVEVHPLLQSGRPRYAVTTDHPTHFLEPKHAQEAVKETTCFVQRTMRRQLTSPITRSLLKVASYFAFPPSDCDQEEIQGLVYLFNQDNQYQCDVIKNLSVSNEYG